MRITWPVVVLVVMVLLIVVAVGVDIQLAASTSARNHSPTIRATATPRLVASTPHILATYVTGFDVFDHPPNNAFQFSVTTNGPFDILAACNPYGIAVDHMPPIGFTIFDPNGHQVDQVQRAVCGNDATVWAGYSFVVPEALPPGTYQITNITGPNVCLIILDASA
jgi:hypothetical protein